MDTTNNTVNEETYDDMKQLASLLNQARIIAGKYADGKGKHELEIANVKSSFDSLTHNLLYAGMNVKDNIIEDITRHTIMQMIRDM